MGKWYAGVVHSHTNRSDGKYTPQELVNLAEDKGLDFIMITDHNRFCLEVPKGKNILVIPGTELTIDGKGHTNVWGLKHPFDGFVCNSYEDWEKKINRAIEGGATVCINHPFCSNCGWRWPLEPEKVHCVETWNSPRHTDNIIATRWWYERLQSGKKIPAVGGSDYHRDYLVTDFLDNPTTYVYAEECTRDSILKAIREGHTTISPHVGGQRIEIVSGDYMIGDTVPLCENTTVTVSVDNLKKDRTLVVMGNDGVVFSHKAENDEPFSVNLPIKNAGFIAAHVEYDLNPTYAFFFKYVEKIISHGKVVKNHPPFIYSQTGAIYFE